MIWKTTLVPVVVIACSFGGSPRAVSAAKDDESDKEKTPAEKPAIVSHYEILPAQQGDMSIFVAPGDYVYKTKTFYRWKGVRLSVEKIPENTPYRRKGSLDPETQKYNVVEFDPPISYLRIGPGKVAPGYAAGTADFWKWEGIVLEDSEIPDKNGKALPIREPKRLQVIDIRPPRHLLKQPELWKKPKERKVD